MAPPLKPSCGQVLGDRFLLVEEIGHGGMSTVFKAEDLDNERQLLAVKVPLPQYASGIGSWSMSQREAEIGRKLDHPYILRFINPGPLEHQGYVVTEFVAGTTLATRVGRGMHLAESEAFRVASQCCEAVSYLHEQGFVHYDLKPGGARAFQRSIRPISECTLGLARSVHNRTIVTRPNETPGVRKI